MRGLLEEEIIRGDKRKWELKRKNEKEIIIEKIIVEKIIVTPFELWNNGE